MKSQEERMVIQFQTTGSQNDMNTGSVVFVRSMRTTSRVLSLPSQIEFTVDITKVNL